MKKKILNISHSTLVLCIIIILLVIAVFFGPEGLIIGEVHAAGPDDDQGTAKLQVSDKKPDSDDNNKKGLAGDDKEDSVDNNKTDTEKPKSKRQKIPKSRTLTRRQVVASSSKLHEYLDVKEDVDLEEQWRTEDFFKTEQQKWDNLQKGESTTPESLSSYSVLSSDINSDDSDNTKEKKLAVKKEEESLKEFSDSSRKRVRFSETDERIPRNYKRPKK